MAHMSRKVVPQFSGVGEVRFAGHSGPVRYSIAGDPARLKPGIVRMRGALTTTPEIAADAFRAGEGVLTLETGAALRITMLAHTAGGTDVFIELKV